MPFIWAVSTNSACRVVMVAARRLRTSTVENPSAIVRAGRNRLYRWPMKPEPNPFSGNTCRCTLNKMIRMMPSQKAGMAKLSVKKTRADWSSTPPRRRPDPKPTGKDIAAASTAL